ncbi:phosphatase PAP2 family protein [Streptomyces sp. NPDC059740]|uniref:phosphatase PAP2 family protein n=1 Tax=Streptomyces sp. NPDC059740 TaxID=3346926 RepID=UPI0036513CC6
MSHASGAATADARRAGRRPTIAGWVAVASAAAFLLLTVSVLVTDGDPLPGDVPLHLWALHHRGTAIRRVARAVTASGTGIWPYLLALAAGLIGTRNGPDRLRRATLAVAVLATGQAIRFGLMEALARPRPARTDWATHASGLSFPSGHSTTSALVAGLLCWALARSAHRTLAGVAQGVALAWALAVGLTRIQLGVHWPSDVLAGWCLAGAWLAFLAALMARLKALPQSATTTD